MVLLQHVNQDPIPQAMMLHLHSLLFSYLNKLHWGTKLFSQHDRKWCSATLRLLEKGEQLKWYKVVMGVLISFQLPPLRIMENLCFDWCLHKAHVAALLQKISRATEKSKDRNHTNTTSSSQLPTSLCKALPGSQLQVFAKAKTKRTSIICILLQ